MSSPVYWVVNAKAIKTTGLACVALMFASCASNPNYSNNAYSGGGYPGYPNGGGIDYTKTAALVAAGVAGFSLYHYNQEKNKRQDAERALNRRQGNWNRNGRQYNNGQFRRY